MNTGKVRRLQRLSRQHDERFLLVPMDHSVSEGPAELTRRFRQVASAAAGAGADGVIVHKGRAGAIVHAPGTDCCGLVVHLSGSTSRGPDPYDKVLVGTVTDAVRVGADAVSVHINVGAPSERSQLRDLGDVASSCESLGMPLLAMMYVRGPGIGEPFAATALAHAVNVALDLGADLVKTPMPRPFSSIGELVSSCQGPVIISGGPMDEPEGLLDMARLAMASGAAGLAVGRRVWASRDPGGVVSDLASIVHQSEAGGRTSLVLAGAEEPR